jgi:hypothetical protein
MTPTVQRVEIVRGGNIVQRIPRPRAAPLIEVRAPQAKRATLAVTYDEFETPMALASMHIQAETGRDIVCKTLDIAQRTSPGGWPFTTDRCWTRWHAMSRAQAGPDSGQLYSDSEDFEFKRASASLIIDD